MAGSLVLLDSVTASNSATVSLGASNWDSSYDVYMVEYNNVVADTDAQYFRIRVLKSSSADTTSNYDRAYKKLESSTSFANRAGSNLAYWYTEELGTSTQEQNNGILYLFNFNNSSEYSFITVEESTLNSGGTLTGRQGGGVHTVASASNGIQFYMASGNIASGEFKLYGLKK
tara:strand:+ start:98 stop:616 length:519 start_codon:yes stop_codon:yes gene_type:complete